MTIVYIFRSMAKLAGTERVLTDKMNYLASIGYNIYIITYEQGEHPIAFKFHQNIVHIDLGTRFFTLSQYNIFKRYWKYIKLRYLFRKKMESCIKQIKPDIIIYTTYSLNVIDIITKLKCKAKKIVESHVIMGSITEENDSSNNTFIQQIKKHFIYRNLKYIKKADKIVVLTKEDARQWSQIKKAQIIPNPVTIFPDNTVENNSNKILCVGRLEKEKGFDLLINAWKKIADEFPNWNIEIYGSGGEYNNLLQQIKINSLTGSIQIKPPTINIYEQYQNSSLFILSSRYEAFGLVLIEAMSCGRPCISFNCPSGPNEIIIDGINGLLIQNGNIDDLAIKIKWMINHENERKEMGKNARIFAQKFKKENIMQQWIKLFNESTTNKVEEE